MSETRAWLAERLADAPEQLRARMAAAVDSFTEDLPLHEHLALAAQACFARALGDASRDGALDLLAADALLTHACEAAAEAGSTTLLAFADAWSADRFERLLKLTA